jgi:hypothetical protein
MELRNPIIRAEFVDNVMNLQDPDSELLIPRTYMLKFVSLVFPSEEYLRSLPNRLFPVSLHDAAELLQIKHAMLKEIIDPSPSHSSQKTSTRLAEFVEGRDFIKGNRERQSNGGVTRPIYMSVSCFKRASMCLRKETGMLARQYFNLVSKGYEDFMGEAISERLKWEDPKVTQEKHEHPHFFRDASRPGNYSALFDENKVTYMYHGITDDLNTRMQRHISTKPYIFKQVDYAPDFDPEFEEVCVNEFDAPARVAIPAGYKGTKSVFVYNEIRTPKIRSFCHGEIAKMREKYFEEFSPPPSTIPGRIPKNPKESPLFYKGKREKGYDWRDGDVVEVGKGGIQFLQKVPTIEDFRGNRQKSSHDQSKWSKGLQEPKPSLNQGDFTHLMKTLTKEQKDALLQLLLKSRSSS